MKKNDKVTKQEKEDKDQISKQNKIKKVKNTIDEPKKSDKSETLYVVEKILDHREDSKRRKNKISLLIKWKGYDEPTWESEVSMRESINDDVDSYLKKNRVIKKTKSKKGKAIFERIVKCNKNHKDVRNFKQTINDWEVGDVLCEGKCGLDFGIKKCGHKNAAWVCDGRIAHGCKIVYCTQCYCNLLDTRIRRGRNHNNEKIELASVRPNLRQTTRNVDILKSQQL